MQAPVIIATKIHQATAQLATERKPGRRRALLDLIADFEAQLWDACRQNTDSDEEQAMIFEFYLTESNPIHKAA